jgi:two-component system, OmpR family, sensor kinase
MNRLWIRLSIAFGIVVSVGAVTIIGLSVLLARMETTAFPFLNILKRPDGLLETLQHFYETNHSWQNSELVLRGAEAMEMGPEAYEFSVDDFPSGATYNAHPVRSRSLLEAMPILVNNVQVGTLNIYRDERPRVQPVSPQSFLLDRLRDASLLIALVGGTIGLLFGVLVSRTLTAPLSELAAAAQAIGERKLEYRVGVKGTTEIVAVAAAFNNMATALETGEAARRNLLADVAHELRTPLSVLRGNLQALLDGIYPFEASEVARLYHQTEMLNHLVNDLRELSLAEAHQLPLNFAVTNVQQLLLQIHTIFTPAADEAGIVFQLNVETNLPTVKLDAQRFTQILDNLISNALRHTPSGGTVAITASIVDDLLRVVVADSGEGIAAEHLPHVFDRFYRTNWGRSRASGGAGLGLAIVRAIVELHGGSVKAESEGIPGKGSSFIVCLPLG